MSFSPVTYQPSIHSEWETQLEQKPADSVGLKWLPGDFNL